MKLSLAVLVACLLVVGAHGHMMNLRASRPAKTGGVAKLDLTKYGRWQERDDG